MPPFREGGGYWFYFPKPWNHMKCPTSNERKIKSERLSNVVENLRSMKKKSKCGHHRSTSYSKGQSLFLLPKTLSKGVRQWDSNEARFKRWFRKMSEQRAAIAPADSSASEGVSQSFNELSLLNHSYEEEPLRGYYAVWLSSASKASIKKLSTPERVFDYISGVWKSREIDKLLAKSPKGGVHGRIEDISLLSAKGRDVLQRWSRVVSHYDAGNESGEDEDPVEMWNRAVETSMLSSSVLSPGTLNNEHGSSRKRKNDNGDKENYCDVEEPPLAQSTAIRPKRTDLHQQGSTDNSDSLPVVTRVVSQKSPVSENVLQAKSGDDTPSTSTRKRSKVKDMHSREQKLPVTPDGTSSESRRRSPRLNVTKSTRSITNGSAVDKKGKMDHEGSISTSRMEVMNNSSKERINDENLNIRKKNDQPLRLRTPQLKIPDGVRTPMSVRNVSNSLRRRALLNSALRSSAQKSPFVRNDSSQKRGSEAPMETPKIKRVRKNDASTPTCSGNRRSPKTKKAS
ncbi:hypothetical protein V3C99_012671 [Haemonchus contortus]